MLTDDFVPVAIDQWYERRQKDAKGDYYRKIAGQGPRNDFKHTTQGHYACDASGKLLGFNGNHIDVDRVKKMMRKALDDFDQEANADVKVIEPGTPDARFNIVPPDGGLIFRVYSKILNGYEEPKNNYEKSFQKSIGQDSFWIQADEKVELIKSVESNGNVPAAIARRIARFHLIDNTRGEPPRWTVKEIRELSMKVTNGVIEGSVKLSTADDKRGYEAELFGRIEVDGDEVTRFDMVAEGMFWGKGPHTGSGPKGKFPLAITFTIVDPTKRQNQAIPHGAKGWVEGYYQSAE
jgi:hypothetical protein